MNCAVFIEWSEFSLSFSLERWLLRILPKVDISKMPGIALTSNLLLDWILESGD